MRASPEDQVRLQRAQAMVLETAQTVFSAKDTETMRVRLATVWAAVRRATEVVNDVEESTRNNALRQLESQP